MIKRAVDETTLNDKLRELNEQWEPHDTAMLPKRLAVGRITLRPDVYQARGTRTRGKHGDVNDQKVGEMRALLNSNPEMDMTPVLVLHLPKCERRLKTDTKRRRHTAAAPRAHEDRPRGDVQRTENGTLIQGTA